MLKEVDFNAIAAKIAFLFLILRLPLCIEWLTNREYWGSIGWISFGAIALLIPVCGFFAVKKEAETEDTRRFSVFFIRLFGLYQGLAGLWSIPSIVKYLISENAWEYYDPKLLLYLVLFLYGVSLFFIPGLWNRLILAVGRLLRRY